ncbi:MAG: voltage-gated chloride channel family protein [Turneriella sp.]|nr:voltage-gated chloride channel family protein [Turneriella sp.]
MGRPNFLSSALNFEQFLILRHLLKWALLSLPLALAVGSLVALFLWLLDRATELRTTYPWLLFFLPAAGVFIYVLYRKFGKNAEAGNNLIMEEIHQPGGGVPLRMTPLVLSTTIITHLFGGSAGREGTAVQMGGSIAGRLGRWFALSKEDSQIMLMAGIAAGFGAVFGTPLAGAIFALEVLTIGKIRHNALLPVFFAAFFADLVCSAWGISHAHYRIAPAAAVTALIPQIKIDPLLFAKVMLAGVCFGLAGYFFSELSHQIKHATQKIPHRWMAPVLGGLAIVALAYLLGTRDYLGIGVGDNGTRVSIAAAFSENGADALSWFWKLLFTAITIGTGFKGGEVTPLFFIGATLGNTLAHITGAPVDLMAGLGFVAVFAAATNTPIACTIMGVELFGGEYIFYIAAASFTAYYFSGHSGIYLAQRLGSGKTGAAKTTAHETLRGYTAARTEHLARWFKREKE